MTKILDILNSIDTVDTFLVSNMHKEVALNEENKMFDLCCPGVYINTDVRLLKDLRPLILLKVQDIVITLIN